MDDFKDLIKQIAIELTIIDTDTVWYAKIETDFWCPTGYLESMDGKNILLRADDRDFTPKTRIEITGSWPYSKVDNFHWVSHHDNPPKITVSMSRTPQAIVKDIVSRFLPQFNKVWSKALQGIAQHDQYLADVETRKQTILNSWPSARLVSHYTDRVYIKSGHIVAGSKTLSITLNSLTIEQVAAIAEIVEP